MRRRTLFMVGSTGVCLAMGCASILGITDGKPLPEGGMADDSGDGMRDTGRDIEMIPDVNIEANIAICDGITRSLVDGGVFLSPGGDDNGPCSQAMPCKTLSKAQAIAVQRAAPIYLAPGDYPGGLSITGGTLVVEGGWTIDAGSWQPACDYNLAHIKGRLGVNMGAAAVHITGGAKVVLRLVSIEDDPSAAPAGGASRYGIFFEGQNLALENVAVRAAPASAGAAGNPGSGSGPENCQLGNAMAGAPGTAGTPGGLGLYTVAGFIPDVGLTGVQGSPGAGGGPGQNGAAATCTACDGAVALDDASMMCATRSTTIYGAPGGPGCGGGGGNGGLGGTGGGASIGLYIAGNGQVVLRYGTLLAAGAGGQGGPGGSGAQGQSGRVGYQGLPASAMNQACNNNMCGPGNGTCYAAGGMGGSAGGQGGQGGPGGGGAGGPSIAVVHPTMYSFTVLDGSVLTFSNGGTGGAPNGQMGDQGKERTY